MQKIVIITGSTRPNRKSKVVAEWVASTAGTSKDFEFEVVDLADINLPFLDESIPPMADRYQNEHTKRWAEIIGPADGYILVTPEYNHSYSPVLKNALDFLYKEWNRKPVGFVGYGVANGVRAIEHLKQVVVQLDMAPLNAHVGFNVMAHWDHDGAFKPDESAAQLLGRLLGELKWWGETLKAGREQATAA
ncbi:MAG TPA: NAD(P)H-dependent oxidoreductase [Patescibacteria group bacterium]|nr:NAD(P)H-dependent oxidoreductase [Patescibacteria group bacterium]